MSTAMFKKRFTKRFTGAYFVSVLCLSVSVVQAKTVAVVGETFPVAEQSFLAFIESRLHQLEQTGEMDLIEKQMVLDASEHANRPSPVGLARTEVSSTHFYTPAVVLSSAIRDQFNRVLIPQGTSVNALEHLPNYQPHWLFFNADDAAQVRWAVKALTTHPDAKMILTGGAIGPMERALKRDVFFDQSGRISHQLTIQHVPSQVSREGLRLRVDELAIGEDGDVR